MDSELDASLDLLRRLNPQRIKENTMAIIDLVPEFREDILQSVDLPLVVGHCKSSRDYLQCDYNRDGNSYRSPWTNSYDPPLEEGPVPSADLRKLEVTLNDAFDTYRDLYFEGGISSVYLWDLENGFAGVVLIKKTTNENFNGSWDSIHVFEVTKVGKNANYKLTSTVLLYMMSKSKDSGDVNLSGSLTRQMELDAQIDEFVYSNVVNMGKMVEDMEIKMRNALQEIYFGKTKDVINELRSLKDLMEVKKQELLTKELVGKLYERK